MEHEFHKGVPSITLVRVVKLEISGNVFKIFGRDQGSAENELQAAYKYATIKGWYIDRKLDA